MMQKSIFFHKQRLFLFRVQRNGKAQWHATDAVWHFPSGILLAMDENTPTTMMMTMTGSSSSSSDNVGPIVPGLYLDRNENGPRQQIADHEDEDRADTEDVIGFPAGFFYCSITAALAELGLAARPLACVAMTEALEYTACFLLLAVTQRHSEHDSAALSITRIKQVIRKSSTLRSLMTTIGCNESLSPDVSRGGYSCGPFVAVPTLLIVRLTVLFGFS
jgi:hypothetical protein